MKAVKVWWSGSNDLVVTGRYPLMAETEVEARPSLGYVVA